MTTGRRTDVLRLLGLARRAGAVAPGVDAARRAIRQGEARLVLVAADASGVQLQKLGRTMKGARDVPRATVASRASLGAAIGLSPVSAVAVTQDAFADRLLRGLGAHAPGGPVVAENGREACGS